MNIAQRTFLVTGGGSGLGAATVRKLVSAGARVVIADLNREQGEALAVELGQAVRFVATDVTKEADAQTAIRAAIELSQGDGLRGVVNCAGIVAGEKVLSKTGPHALDSFSRVIQINLIGTFNVSRLAAAAMADTAPTDTAERGVIINVASVAAFEGQIGQAAYAASKGGVASMTLPMARELARHAIRVVTIAPGLIETPMVQNLPQQVRDSLQQSTVFPARLGHPDEFASLVVHILENQLLNGSVLRLDGAVRLSAH